MLKKQTNFVKFLEYRDIAMLNQNNGNYVFLFILFKSLEKRKKTIKKYFFEKFKLLAQYKSLLRLRTLKIKID